MSAITAGAHRAELAHSTIVDRVLLRAGFALVRWSRHRAASRRIDRDIHRQRFITARAGQQREHVALRHWYLRS